MAKKDLKFVCDRCGGTGFEDGIDPITGDPASVPDPKCSGTGSLALGFLDDDLIDQLNDMQDKINDIFEKVNE